MSTTMSRILPSDSSSTLDRHSDISLILKRHGDSLTLYEKNEIKDYVVVHYAGHKCIRKISAPTSGPNDGYDNTSGEYIVVPQDHIAYRYEILGELGAGAFGQVVKALDHSTGAEVAIKLLRNKKSVARQGQYEIQILQHIKDKDPSDVYGIVRMLENFIFRNHVCIVYELLGENLYDRMKSMDFTPMTLSEVKRVAVRMLVALTFLWRENIVHCDLKPENILVRSEENTKVKVIDLGSACYDKQSVYTYIQSRYYRAPEIILGLPYGRPIDLWSYACILCELAAAYPLFAGENDADQLFSIMEYLGAPDETLISKCRRRRDYFQADYTPKIRPNSKGKMRQPISKTLSSFLKVPPDHEFIDFLMQFFRWDPSERVSPRDAMRHPWVVNEFVARVQKPPVSAISDDPHTNGTSPEEENYQQHHQSEGDTSGKQQSHATTTDEQTESSARNPTAELPTYVESIVQSSVSQRYDTVRPNQKFVTSPAKRAAEAQSEHNTDNGRDGGTRTLNSAAPKSSTGNVLCFPRPFQRSSTKTAATSGHDSAKPATTVTIQMPCWQQQFVRPNKRAVSPPMGSAAAPTTINKAEAGTNEGTEAQKHTVAPIQNSTEMVERTPRRTVAPQRPRRYVMPSTLPAATSSPIVDSTTNEQRGEHSSDLPGRGRRRRQSDFATIPDPQSTVEGPTRLPAISVGRAAKNPLNM